MTSTPAAPDRSQRSFTWEIRAEGEQTRVTFRGDLEEHVDLSALGAQLRGAVLFDLAGVRHINSCGVREWVNFMHQLDGVTALSLVNCSTTFVIQLNLICNFRGPGKVISFYAPFLCGGCDEEREVLLAAAPGLASAVPEIRCDRCQQPMTLDDLPERYFAFLADV